MSDEPPTLLPIGPLEDLPRIDRRLARLAAFSDRDLASGLLREAIAPFSGSSGLDVAIGRLEVRDRAAGLQRPGVVAQFVWPRRNSRFAIGIETPLAHAMVDALLGFSRAVGQEHLQVTPVEWGLLTFVISRSFGRLAERAETWDFLLDRVGPDPFHTEGLGPIATVRYPVTIGETTGSARLWLPEPVLDEFRAGPSPCTAFDPRSALARLAEVTSDWRAELGRIRMARGLGKLKAGGVLPLVETKLAGSPASLTGRLELVAATPGARFVLSASPVSLAGMSRITIHPPLRREPSPREPHVMSGPSSPGVAPAELPVTLTVELGRISLPLSRISELREGELIELGRGPHEPVELTSGGRLIARGELIQIDTELGVRVTSVYL